MVLPETAPRRRLQPQPADPLRPFQSGSRKRPQKPRRQKLQNFLPAPFHRLRHEPALAPRSRPQRFCRQRRCPQKNQHSQRRHPVAPLITTKDSETLSSFPFFFTFHSLTPSVSPPYNILYISHLSLSTYTIYHLSSPPLSSPPLYIIVFPLGLITERWHCHCLCFVPEANIDSDEERECNPLVSMSQCVLLSLGS